MRGPSYIHAQGMPWGTHLNSRAQTRGKSRDVGARTRLFLLFIEGNG